LTDLKKSILFIGNFLSAWGMNQSISKDLHERFSDKGWKVAYSSTHRNKVLRLMDMMLTAIRQRNHYQVANIDVFSDKAFIIAEVMSLVFNLLKKPVVGTLRGGHLVGFSEQNPKRVRRVLRRLTKITTPSLYLRDHFSEIRDDIIRIPNGVDLESYPNRRREKPALKLIWLRALHQIYAPIMAVEVLQLLQNKFPDISLTMVGPDKGDGSLEKVRALTAQYGLTNAVQIIGGVDKKDVPHWLNQGEIFINTTRYESFGVSVLEAAACGLPIVTTDAGELPYMWQDGADALVVPVDDASAMAEAVERILTEPDLAQKMSINARKKAEDYDWSLIMPQWESLFQSLISDE